MRKAVWTGPDRTGAGGGEQPVDVDLDEVAAALARALAMHWGGDHHATAGAADAERGGRTQACV
ncbi:hypothetical protein OG394_37710 [Kribbella sp. NBC_01245]|uniref:hypothetical protein n=1 Tax=Kribbella sp. NBC_01245 TaxID=2903578 RepID=UPI002E2A8269|nr:hypothetical protein [Kribbella sp. NBC_01245]